MPFERLSKTFNEAHFFHLNKAFEAHQKVATLSSKMPREKGNIRLIGSRIAASGAKGGRNGKHSSRNVRVVAVARRIKRAVLISVRLIIDLEGMMIVPTCDLVRLSSCLSETCILRCLLWISSPRQGCLGAIFFVLSLFEQMSLYYAPAIGSYLLAKCIYLP